MLLRNLYNKTFIIRPCLRKKSPLKSRLLAAGVHFGISVAIAALAAWLVFEIWYPYPYREISAAASCS
jgi:uncharacterized membrane protein YqhA